MSNLLNKSDSLITSCTTSSCCTSHYFPLSLFDALLFYYLTYYINTIFSGKFRYVYHTFMSFSHSLNFFYLYSNVVQAMGLRQHPLIMHIRQMLLKEPSSFACAIDTMPGTPLTQLNKTRKNLKPICIAIFFLKSSLSYSLLLSLSPSPIFLFLSLYLSLYLSLSVCLSGWLSVSLSDFLFLSLFPYSTSGIPVRTPAAISLQRLDSKLAKALYVGHGLSPVEKRI